MGLFNNFPWTNLHELNLQWIVNTLKKCYSPENPPEAMVISVNGESGIVTLYPNAVIRFPDVQDIQWNMWRNTDGVSTGIQFEKGQPAKRIDGQNRIVIYDANNPPPYPVVSVNGETGEIELYTEAYVEFPDITDSNWGIQRKLNTGEANETLVGIMFDDTGKAMIIKDEDSNDLYSENNPPPYPVISVDGNTGNIITWANHTTEMLELPASSNTDNWGISRDITHGNLSIRLMYDDNIQNVSAYMIFDDGVNTPTSKKLLTTDDIPSNAGVISINSRTGIVTLTGADILLNSNSQNTIDQEITNIETDINDINDDIDDINDEITAIKESTKIVMPGLGIIRKLGNIAIITFLNLSGTIPSTGYQLPFSCKDNVSTICQYYNGTQNVIARLDLYAQTNKLYVAIPGSNVDATYVVGEMIVALGTYES